METVTAKASSIDLAVLIGDQISEVFKKLGVNDYCLGLNVAGKRTFYASGRICSEEEVSRPSLFGFRLGCMFRPFLAAAALELSRTAQLDLSTPIGEFFAELSGSANGKLVNIQHLISHTTGYAGFSSMGSAHAFQDLASALRAIRKAPRVFIPGQIYHYEHSSTAMLGEILERASGKKPPELVEELVFSPLGVRNVRDQLPRADFSPSDNSRHQHGRELLSAALSIPDVMSVAESFMHSTGDAVGGASLSRNTRESLQRLVVSIPRISGTVAWKMLATGSGLGLHKYRSGVFGYEGNTGTQAIGFRFSPANQWAIVLGINRPQQQLLRRAIFGAILNIFDEHQLDTPSRHEAAPPILTLPEIVGDYFGDHGFCVRVRQDKHELTVETRWMGGIRTAVRGRFSNDGFPLFEAVPYSAEPNFFRYPLTGEMCVVTGMCTLKRQPGWLRPISILRRRKFHAEPPNQ